MSKQGFEKYLIKGGEKLRYGYTTGTAATIGAAAAATFLLTGVRPSTLAITTPKGWQVRVGDFLWEGNETYVTCGVKKDGGDDIDVTHNAIIYVTVHKIAGGIHIEGGRGVGRVTRKGLNQPVGAAAINEVPRQMITSFLKDISERHDYAGGFSVVITVPQGEDLAKKTFNPDLGIVGGISILGTSGIVEPKSLDALVATIRAEVSMHAAEGKRQIIGVPGNYGKNFLKHLGLSSNIPIVGYSNFLGDFIDIACEAEFAEILIAGHIGKMVKVAGGIMNTHSSNGDCRREIFAAHAAVCGGSTALARKIMGSATTEDCLVHIKEEGIKDQVLEQIMEKIDDYLTKKSREQLVVGAIAYSMEDGFLGATKSGEELMKGWQINE